MTLTMEPESREILVEGSKALGVHLDEDAVKSFNLFLKELMKWNQKINLTAIRTERDIVTKHFLDSLSVHPYLPKVCSLLDLGAGAGFPGIPLRIADPTIEVTLIDSVRKKIDFERHVIRSLGLKGIEAVHARAEDKEILKKWEARFDRVVSRAFADLRTFLRLSRPFLKRGGIALAMKGVPEGEEIRALNEERETGYRLRETVAFDLPFTSLKRTILLFEKE